MVTRNNKIEPYLEASGLLHSHVEKLNGWKKKWNIESMNDEPRKTLFLLTKRIHLLQDGQFFCLFEVHTPNPKNWTLFKMVYWKIWLSRGGEFQAHRKYLLFSFLCVDKKNNMCTTRIGWGFTLIENMLAELKKKPPWQNSLKKVTADWNILFHAEEMALSGDQNGHHSSWDASGLRDWPRGWSRPSTFRNLGETWNLGAVHNSENRHDSGW